jgi:hypothetical protein
MNLFKNISHKQNTTTTATKWLKPSNVNVNVNTPWLVLHHSCIPVKVDINQKGVDKK